MRKGSIPGKNGYDIPYVDNTCGKDRVLFITHGFTSSKECTTNQLLAGALPGHGIGTFAIDLPAHGDSPVDGEYLRLSNCLSDIDSACAYVRRICPGVRLYFFGSSFGAYLTLRYLSADDRRDNQAFLRSAAVDMPGIFRRNHSDEIARELKVNGCFTISEDCVRPLKITKGFLTDLEEYGPADPAKAPAKLHMIHGSGDSVAPYADAQAFAKAAGCPLTTVPGAEHRLDEPGQPELVLKTALDFFG